MDIRYQNAIARAASLGYRILGTGRGRVVYDMGDGKVLKLPLNGEGELSNWREPCHFANNQNGDEIYAWCEAVEFEGVDAVIMEKVQPVVQMDTLPTWTNYVDCRQVGWTEDGRLVAYDFGD